MNNGISFRFNFETDNYEAVHQLIPKILEKVKGLQISNPGYRSIELNLFKPGNNNTSACLTIHSHDSVIREESREEDWDHAIEMVFNHVEASSQHAIKLE